MTTLYNLHTLHAPYNLHNGLTCTQALFNRNSTYSAHIDSAAAVIATRYTAAPRFSLRSIRAAIIRFGALASLGPITTISFNPITILLIMR